MVELDEDIAEELEPEPAIVLPPSSPPPAGRPAPPSQRPPRMSSTPPPPPIRGSLRASKVPSPPTRPHRAPSIRTAAPSSPPPVSSPVPPPVRASAPAVPFQSTPTAPQVSRAPAPPVRPSRAPSATAAVAPAPVPAAHARGPAVSSARPEVSRAAALGEEKVGPPPAPRRVSNGTAAQIRLPEVESGPELSRRAYSHLAATTRVAAPTLTDRVAAAKELCVLCEKRLKTETLRSRQARLCYEIARLYEGPLGDWESAHRYYQKAHGLEPQFEPVLSGLVRVRARLGQWEGTLKPLEEQSDLSATPAEKAALLFVKALIQEVRLDRLSDARADFERALRLCPDDTSLSCAVERHARREQDWKTLDAALTTQASLVGKDRGLGATLLAERARVAEHFRKHSKEAAELYGHAFSTDPLASSAALSLEHLLFLDKEYSAGAELLRKRAELILDPSSRASSLSSAAAILIEARGEFLAGAELLELAWQAQPDDLGVLRTLSEVYERGGEFSGMVSALARLEQRSDDPNERAELCVVIGEIMLRRLGKREEGIAYFERARASSPGNPVCVAALCAYFAERNDWDRYVQVLGEEEAVSNSRSRRAALHCQIARTYEHRLGRLEAAIEHYRGALGLEPENESAFRELVRLLEAAGRFDEVVELHERAAADAPNDEVCFAHLFKIGQIFEDLLNAPDRAVLVYRRILDKRSDHFGAFFALQRSAGRAGAFDVLVDALVREAAVHENPRARLPLLHRAAEVTLENLGKKTEALDLFGQVLQLDKHYAPTLSALSSFYETEGRHKDLLKVLTLQLITIESDREKSEHLLRMGRLCEDALGDDEKALSYFTRAHEAVAGQPAASAAVRRSLRRLGKGEELSTFLTENIKSLEPGPERARLGVILGQLFEMRLGKLQAALGAYEKALEDQPDSAAAADGRIRVLEQRGDPVKTAEALEQRALSSRDQTVRLWATLRRGELMETYDRSGQRAIEIFETVLAESTQHPAALLALGRLYAGKGNAAQLLRILRLQVGAFGEKSNKTAALRQALRLVEAHLDEPESAATTVVPDEVSALLSLSPGDRAALRAAEYAALRADKGDELAQVDERFVNVLTDGPLRSFHRTRLGEFLEAKSPVHALSQHRPALVEDPENIGAARGMSRIAQVVDDPDLLIEAAHQEAQVVGNKERSAGLLVRAAELLQSHGDVDRAATLLRDALASCPESVEAAGALYALLSQRGAYDDLLAILTDAAGRSARPEVAAEHWVAVAKIYADQRGDVPAAIAILGRLDKAGKATLGVLLELAELYFRDRQWVPAVDRLRKCIALKPDDQTLIALRLRLAEVLDEQLKKATDATRELREVLHLVPRHLGALRRLLAIQLKEGSPAALETAQLLSEVSDGPEKAQALAAQGRLLSTEGKAADAARAYAGAVALVGLEPEEASNGMRSILRSGRGTDEEWTQYETALSEYLRHSKPGEHQARVFLELSEVVSRRDEQQASAVLGAGLGQNPSAQALRTELISKLKRNKQYQEALPEIQALLRAEPVRATAWQDLVFVHDALGHNAEAHLATGPLVLLGHGNDLQVSSWNARQPRPALLPLGAFGPTMLAETLAEPVGGDALLMLEVLGTTAHKVFPGNLEAYGTSAKNRVGPRGPHPVRTALDRVCHCFGSPEIDLYFSDSAERMHVVLTDPVGIVVPVNFSALPEPDQVFYLGCLAANIARHAAVVDALSLQELRLLFGACERLVSPSAEVPLVDPQELAEATRRLHKALPWLSKGKIEDAARRYSGAPVNDVERFAEVLKGSARRAAMLLADDIRPVIQLRQGQGGLIGISNEEAPAVIGDLLPFWASSEAVAIRRAIGAL